MLIPRIRSLVVIAVTLGVAAPLAAQTNAPAVYSDSQALRGAAVFRRICSACHATSQFTGTGFFGAWAGRPVFEMFEQIRTTMPQDNPGRLRRQEYIDVVAYVLSLNGVPAGSRELPPEEVVLRQVYFGGERP